MTVLLLTACLAGISGAPASFAYDLTGTWHSPQGPGGSGTTVRLTQTASRVEWEGGPDNQDWIQVFSGTLSGNVFEGEFHQHAPSDTHVYSGTLSAEVISECEFRTLHVLQAGQSDAGGATFTRTPCPTSAPSSISGSWQVRAKGKIGATVVAVVGAGHFTAAADGGISDSSGVSGNLIVVLRNPRESWRDDLWHIRVSGPGKYSADAGGVGELVARAEVISTANRGSVHICKRDPVGKLLLKPDPNRRSWVGLADVCGHGLLSVHASIARAIAKA